MKQRLVWPLLIVALLALGTFSVIGLNGEGTGEYINTPKYFVSPPGARVLPDLEAPVYYISDPSSLNANVCVVAREVKRVESLHGIPSSFGFERLLVDCAARGW